MKSSRRDFSNDVGKHRSILKNNQNTYYPRFGFTPKTGIAFPKQVFSFYCDVKVFCLLQLSIVFYIGQILFRLLFSDVWDFFIFIFILFFSRQLSIVFDIGRTSFRLILVMSEIL